MSESFLDHVPSLPITYFSTTTEILYEIAGFNPEIRLGVGRRFAPLRNWWPALLSGLVAVSGMFHGIPED